MNFLFTGGWANNWGAFKSRGCLYLGDLLSNVSFCLQEVGLITGGLLSGGSYIRVVHYQIYILFPGR